jgi:hypothetical protein
MPRFFRESRMIFSKEIFMKKHAKPREKKRFSFLLSLLKNVR